MAFLEFGNVHGLAYRHDWDKDIDTLYRGQAMIENAKKESQQMSMIIGERLKFGQAYADYDANELKKFTYDKLKEISKMFRQNPNLLNTPVGWAMFSQKADELVNNDITRKSLQYKIDKEKFQKLLEEHPDAAKDPEIIMMAQQFENYNKYGSADGISENRILPKFYRPDLEFSVDKAASEIAKSVKRDSRIVTKNGYDLEEKYVPEERLEAVAASILAGKDGYKWKKQFMMLPETDKYLYGYDGNNLDVALKKFIIENVNARVEVDHQVLGESFEKWKMKEQIKFANDLYIAKAKESSKQSFPYSLFKSTFIEAKPGFHNVGVNTTKYIAPTFKNPEGKEMIELKPGQAKIVNSRYKTNPNEPAFIQSNLEGIYQYEISPEFYKASNGDLYSMGYVVFDYRDRFNKLLENESDPEKQEIIIEKINEKIQEIKNNYGITSHIIVDEINRGVFRIPVAVKFDVNERQILNKELEMQKDIFGNKSAEGVFQYQKIYQNAIEIDNLYNEYMSDPNNPRISKEEFIEALNDN